MKTSKITYLTIFLMLFGSMFIGTNPASGLGILSSEIVPGNNYWYSVASFPDFQELIDLTGVNDDPYSDIVVTATGGLQGSSLYAKVLSTQSESMNFSDGVSPYVVNLLPTVDLSVGMITANPLSFTVKNKTTGIEIATSNAPAGLGLPLPVIFGTSTYFNVSSSWNSLLPVPFALNDDYANHASIISQLSILATTSGLGTVSLTNDASVFKIDFDMDLNSTDKVGAKGLAKWSKTSGVIEQLQLTMYNVSTNVDLFTTIDISLARTENINVAVEVGDTFDLGISQATFDFATTGFGGGSEDPTGILNEIKSNFTSLVGQNLLELEVIETKGMYYRVDGTMWNGTGEPRVPIADGGEAWMVGFGRMGPGMGMNLAMGGSGNQMSALGLNSLISHDELRTHLAPGFVVSEDYEIYSAWDKTMTFAMETGLTTFLAAMAEIEEYSYANGEFFQLRSSVSEDPVVVAGYTGGETADGGYSTDVTINWDVEVDENRTAGYEYWDGFNWIFVAEGWRHNTVESSGALRMQTAYTNHGDFDFWKMDGFVNVHVIESNETGQLVDVTVSISNFILEFDGTMTRVNPIVDTTTSDLTTDDPGTTDEEPPALDLPGFELGFALLAFASVAFVVRRRKL